MLNIRCSHSNWMMSSPEFKIFRAIILFVTIFVVNKLSAFERSANALLHYVTMFGYPSLSTRCNFNPDITIRVNVFKANDSSSSLPFTTFGSFTSSPFSRILSFVFQCSKRSVFGHTFYRTILCSSFLWPKHITTVNTRLIYKNSLFSRVSDQPATNRTIPLLFSEWLKLSLTFLTLSFQRQCFWSSHYLSFRS